MDRGTANLPVRPPAIDAVDLALSTHGLTLPWAIHGLSWLETTLAIGTVKWFNSQKGYGFICPLDGGKDVFVHISAVERAGLGTLNEGQKVKYEIARDRGKEAAANLALAD